MQKPCLAALALLATPALADSEASWEAFREEVGTACLALLEGTEGQGSISVNPFGSESYGAALVTVTTEAGTDRMVCIFDKATKAAELTSPWTVPAE